LFYSLFYEYKPQRCHGRPYITLCFRHCHSLPSQQLSLTRSAALYVAHCDRMKVTGRDMVWFRIHYCSPSWGQTKHYLWPVTWKK